eukprot:1552053-Pleurochrysis_carterae.AAC.1
MHRNKHSVDQSCCAVDVSDDVLNATTMTVLCGGDDDDVMQFSAMAAALKVSGAVKTAASAATLRTERR